IVNHIFHDSESEAVCKMVFIYDYRFKSNLRKRFIINTEKGYNVNQLSSSDMKIMERLSLDFLKVRYNKNIFICLINGCICLTDGVVLTNNMISTIFLIILEFFNFPLNHT